MSQRPSLPKGTRDFSPEDMNKRQFVFGIIQSVYKKYGFKPLETPAMEQLSVLTGKYGDEGDQLIFRVLNSGDFLSKVTEQDYNGGYQSLTEKITEKGLRYDLTVPFARYVVMNRGTMTFPFKRYQIQPVWRADRPQKGRYREFYQCDADVIGTGSLICEAEIIGMINEVFDGLGIKNYQIRVNNRKILAGLAEYMDTPEKMSELCTAIDKLDKIGLQGVEKELNSKGFNAAGIGKAMKLLENSSTSIENLEDHFKGIASAEEGINELTTIFNLSNDLGADLSKVSFDLTLARGLGYYTGTIFEVVLEDVKIGSVSGGGRYDDLTGVFGVPDMSGVGISFGVDRLIDAMQELELFDEDHKRSTDVLVTNFDEHSEKAALKLLSKLRKSGIRCEIYPDPSKLKKQLSYANANSIPFVILLGEDEIKANAATLKSMISGEQKRLANNDLISTLNQELS